jgi:outer membrane protein assembly factor BamB
MKSANPTTSVLVGCVVLLSANGVSAQDWPQWRGPNRDNKVKGFTAPKTWPKELTQKWKTTVGLGDASPVLVGDKLYLLTRQDADEVILCLDAGTGKEVWKDKYAAPAARVPGGGHTGPRSAPVVADGKVCTFGATGVLSCLDAATGKVAWRKDTKARPQFYTASSPLIVDGKCIAYVGGPSKGEIVAYDLASGDEKWKWSGEGPGYGSPVLMTVDGTKMLVTLTEAPRSGSGFLMGIGLGDGKFLWKTAYKSRYNSETPIVDGATVYCSGSGTVAFKIEKKDGSFTANQLWKKTPAAGMYNTPVLKDGMLYGLSASGRGATKIFCLNAKTGDSLWTDDKSRGECGTILDAGSVLLALTSNGELVVFKPSNKEFTEVAKYKVSDKSGIDGPWAYPIIAGNRVFVKGKDALTLWTID